MSEIMSISRHRMGIDGPGVRTLAGSCAPWARRRSVSATRSSPAILPRKTANAAWTAFAKRSLRRSVSKSSSIWFCEAFHRKEIPA